MYHDGVVGWYVYSDVCTEVGDPVVGVEVAVGAEARRQEVDVDAGKTLMTGAALLACVPVRALSRLFSACHSPVTEESVVALLPVRRRQLSVWR